MKHSVKYWPLLVMICASPSWSSPLDVLGALSGGVKRDPFQSPGLTTAKQLLGTISTDTPPATQEEMEEVVWQPQLRAIVYDRTRPLVNIDGHILGVGESIQGYRLHEVKETEVVLIKNSEALMLKVGEVTKR